MPNQKDYDMDFRPKSYWGFDEQNRHIGSGIKGEIRRAEAKELAKDGIIDPVISVESLAEEQRSAVGRVHPWLMGGEFLPDLLPLEVEIARVTLKSTTMDIISIRARRTRHRIIYRIVDEYFDDPLFAYPLIQKTSVKPLKLKQLIKIIDNAQERGLDGEARYSNYEYSAPADPEEYYDFATITSEFYPELTQWYNDANEEWLDKELEIVTGLTKAERFEEEYRDRYMKRQKAVTQEEKQWRQKNSKALHQEREEMEESQLHFVYRERYMTEKSPESEDERNWRKLNEKELKIELDFQKKVQSCINNAEWRTGPGAGGAWGAARNAGLIRQFVEKFIKEHDAAPSGHQKIGTVVVQF